MQLNGMADSAMDRDNNEKMLIVSYKWDFVGNVCILGMVGGIYANAFKIKCNDDSCYWLSAHNATAKFKFRWLHAVALLLNMRFCRALLIQRNNGRQAHIAAFRQMIFFVARDQYQALCAQWLIGI